MLKYHVVTPETTKKLIEKEKLNFEGAQTILDTFEGGNK